MKHYELKRGTETICIVGGTGLFDAAQTARKIAGPEAEQLTLHQSFANQLTRVTLTLT